MNHPRPAEMSLVEASEMIHLGELSIIELVESCLRRVDKLNPSLNALIYVAADEARAQAEALEEELLSGYDRGLLHGLPIVVKDLTDVAGIPSSMGSAFFDDYVPDADAPPVAALRNAGAIVIGKANLHEFALGATNINPHFGAARNPWNPELVPGGSSGGSAAAVASGMALAALGTDTGGSIRLPAALCGLTGLRPGSNTIPMNGTFPLSPSLDTLGPMARSVADLNALLTRISGGVPMALDVGVQRLRIGLVTSTYYWDQTDPEIRTAIEAAVEALRKDGAETIEIDLPDLEGAGQAANQIIVSEAAHTHRERLLSSPDRFGPDVRARLEQGLSMSAVDYIEAQAFARRWKEAVSRIVQQADCQALITPCTPVLAHPIEGSEDVAAARTLLRYTRAFGLLGWPALSIPCGFSSAGLPIGMQLCGMFEDEVMPVASRYQELTDWHERRAAL